MVVLAASAIGLVELGLWLCLLRRVPTTPGSRRLAVLSHIAFARLLPLCRPCGEDGSRPAFGLFVSKCISLIGGQLVKEVLEAFYVLILIGLPFLPWPTWCSRRAESERQVGMQRPARAPTRAPARVYIKQLTRSAPMR